MMRTRSGSTPLPGVALAMAVTMVSCTGESSSLADGTAAYTILTATEDLRIGSVDTPETDLTRFRALAIGPDGRIYSMHEREHRVRIWSADGSPIGSFGGEGEGPGEFLEPFMLERFGRRLVVFDWRTSRASYFDLDGNLIDEATYRPVSPRDRRWATRRADGVFPDGTFFGSWRPSSLPGAEEISASLVSRLGADGSILDTLLVRPLEYSRLILDYGIGEPVFTGQLFGADPIYDIAARRSEIVLVNREIGPDPPRFRVTKIAVPHDTLWSREYGFEPVAIDPAAIDTFARQMADIAVRNGLATSARQVEEEVRTNLFVPPYLPPVDRVVTGEDGTIFLSLADRDSLTTRWLLVRPDGDPHGVVELPDRFFIRTGGVLAAWGMAFDELDVPYIVRFELRPEGSSDDADGVTATGGG
ncbi:MAG: hypothetical protein R3195_18525 [Gemmatimonadota bacterium]|nr:hypothetical protein [Gemmatimonadota bacterium]